MTVWLRGKLLNLRVRRNLRRHGYDVSPWPWRPW